MRANHKPRLHFGDRSSVVRTHDGMLNAVPSGKILAMGAIWNGIRKYTDLLHEETYSFTTPLVPPRLLLAEPAPAELNMGRIFDGIKALQEFADQVAAANSGQTKDGPAEIAEIQSANERFWASHGKAGVNFDTPAAKAWSGAQGPKSIAVGDKRAPAASATRGKFLSTAQINDANAAFWAERAKQQQ